MIVDGANSSEFRLQKRRIGALRARRSRPGKKHHGKKQKRREIFLEGHLSRSSVRFVGPVRSLGMAPVIYTGTAAGSAILKWFAVLTAADKAARINL